MSAPPGWHRQPDGRERWWDGQQWTDQYRNPLPSDPTAPPADPTWSTGTADGGQPPAGADNTQALDVEHTQALPTAGPGEGGAPEGAGPPPSPTYPTQQDYAYPSGAGGLPPASTGYPQPGYGAPGGQYPPPRQGMSSGAKGCLIAAGVVLVILVIAVIAGLFFFSRVAKEVSDTIATTVPTVVPTEVPTTGPSESASASASGDVASVEVSVGEGFDLPRVSVASGWSVAAGSFGSQIEGMTATFTQPQSLPVLFAMSFEPASAGDDPVETVCTAAPESSDATTAPVTCIPLFGAIKEDGRVVVTPAF